MANETRSRSKAKEDEKNNSKGAASKSSTVGSEEMASTSGLRRSVRETPSKRNSSPISSSVRKSERLEKRIPTPPVQNKVEKQNTPSPLRRSERGKKQPSSGTSGSKKSNKSLGLSAKKKIKKEKSVKQLQLETKEVRQSYKPPDEKKIYTARAYRQLFSPQQKKVNVADGGKEMNMDKKNLEGSDTDESNASKNVNSRNENGQGKEEEMRDANISGDSGKTVEESNCSVNEPTNEVAENNMEMESSLLDQNHKLVEEAHPSENGGMVADSEGGDCVMLSYHGTMPEELDSVAETVKEPLQPVLVTPISNLEVPDSDFVLENGFKDSPLNRRRNTLDIDSESTAMSPSKDTRICPADFVTSPGANVVAESSPANLKRQSINHDLSDINVVQHTDTAQPEDRGETGGGVTSGLAEQCSPNFQNKKSSVDVQLEGNQNSCPICKLGGKLLCCEGRGCKKSYHLSCLELPLTDVPPGVWYCPACVRKQINSGVHSVSGGIESIWDVRLEASDDNGIQRKQYLVKYKGLAHVHNRWVAEKDLIAEAPLVLVKFNRKKEATKWKPEWTEPHRLLHKQFLVASKQHDDVQDGCTDDISSCRYLWLVKWHGLDYEHATWELENASFFELPKIQNLMKDYEKRQEKAKEHSYLSGTCEKLEINEVSSIKLMQLMAGGSTGADNNHLEFIHNLLEHWHKGQNAVLIDDQERIVKVVKFISPLSSNASGPFLVVTTPAALSWWDEEFFRLTPSLDAVFYHGDKDLRKSIRAVEFSGKGITCDALVTSPEVIVEDLDVFGPIKWKAVVVDECQLYRIYSHFEQIKSLNANMRLLLYNGQLKDGSIENLLSLLDCQSDKNVSDGLLTKAGKRNGNLKERLSKYVISGSISDTSRFVEYWVPVQISNLQLEHYCDILLRNTLTLCSSSKKDLVGAITDILFSIRKCCDHPYIVNPPPEETIIKDAEKGVDVLDPQVKASGKLQLLEAMLLEIQDKGLRVIVLFQSSGQKDLIGDILDDFVRLRFGQSSYERIDGLVTPKKKQSALHNFNNQKDRFVFLLETRACLPSIKLSSVDTVIIFSSDWSPANDLRNLHKITLDSQLEQLRVFRLYSSFSVEENVLILAKQDKTIYNSALNISWANIQNLLMRGASYMFSKLEEFHSSYTSIASGSSMSNQSSVKDAIRDFLAILSQNSNLNSLSVIMEAKQSQEIYVTNSLLPSEQIVQLNDEESPQIFWKKLLDRKQPEWKFLSCSSQRNRKRVQHSEDFLKKSEGGDEVVKKRKKVANNGEPSKSAPFQGKTSARDNEGSFEVSLHPVCQLISGLGHHLNSGHANHPSRPTYRVSEEPAAKMAKSNERTNTLDSQKSLHHLLKPEIAKLCETLQLPEDVKAVAQSFLEYVMKNHRVNKDTPTILQAFQMSLCWTAASLLKHKLDHKESLALAKQHLGFGCKKDEADYLYSMLRCLKKLFVYHTRNIIIPCSSDTSQSTEAVNMEHLLASSHPMSFPLGLAQQDFSKSIKDIEKKCDKQMKKLSQKQQEEIKEFDKKYNEEKTQLENKKKTEAAVIRLYSHNVMRVEKLATLEIEYKKKFEELDQRMKLKLKNLEEMHASARNNLIDKKSKWVEGVKRWAKEELVSKTPLTETGKSQGNLASLNSPLGQQNYERTPSMQDLEVPLKVPETVSSNDGIAALVPSVPSTAGHIEALPNVSKTLASRDGPEANGPSSDVLENNTNRSPSTEVSNSISGHKVFQTPALPETGNEDNTITDITSPESANATDSVCIVNKDSDAHITSVDQQNGNALTGVTEGSAIEVALQNDHHPPSGSTRLQDEATSLNGNTFEQVDASVNHQNDEVAGRQDNCSSASFHAADFSSASETEQQPNGQDHGPSNISDTSAQMIEGEIGCTNQANSLPVMPSAQHIPADVSPGGLGTPVLATRTPSIVSGVNNYGVPNISPMRPSLLPVYQDPLQIELERIRKDTEQIIRTRDNMKHQLKLDCEKEIEELVAQIRRKYEIKVQEVESEFLTQKKELDKNHNIVLMNKILAEAFRSKCMDIKPSSTSAMQQDVASGLTQQLIHLPLHNTPLSVQRNATATGPSDSPQNVFSGSRSTSRPLNAAHHSPAITSGGVTSTSRSLNAVHNSPAVSSGGVTRPPIINSITPALGNLHSGSTVRAPAPHLQAFRTPSSAFPPNLPSLSVGMPSQQILSNPPTSSAPSQPPFQQEAPTQQAQPNISVHQPEAPGLLRRLVSSALSELELRMETDNQANAHSSSGLNAVPGMGSISKPDPPPGFSLPNNSSTNAAGTSEVVCLSDDEI